MYEKTNIVLVGPGPSCGICMLKFKTFVYLAHPNHLESSNCQFPT